MVNMSTESAKFGITTGFSDYKDLFPSLYSLAQNLLILKYEGVTIQTLLFSNFYPTPFLSISTKACIAISNNIHVFYSYIHASLSYIHSYISLFLLKLLILYYISSTTKIMYYVKTTTDMKQSMVLQPSCKPFSTTTEVLKPQYK